VTALQEARAEWERQMFHMDRDGEPFWPRRGCRSFAAWLAEDMEPRQLLLALPPLLRGKPAEPAGAARRLDDADHLVAPFIERSFDSMR
jgi:hypothetical protein